MRSLVALVGLMLLGVVVWAADISGSWSAAVQLDAGSGTASFVLKQNGEKLTGTYTGALGTADVTGSVKGDAVEWSFENADAGKCVYKGTLANASKITGSVQYGQLGKGTFTAEKK